MRKRYRERKSAEHGSSTQLNAGANVPGSFQYSPAAGVVPAAGQQTLIATFSPTDSADFSTASATVYLTVNKAAPTVAWSAPAAITYGTALNAAQLNATASVPGTLLYSPAQGAVLGAGSQTLSVTFYPSDSRDYSTVTQTTTLTVNKATPSINWAAPAAITYGAALSSAQLNASTATAGTLAYTPASGIVLGAGMQTLNVSFTPTDSADYTTATASVTLLVNKATPPITWTTPAAITYGAALSATQLNASTSTAGSFSYSPAAGATLNAGSQVLNVSFTPTDTTNYSATSSSVTLLVNKAPLTLTANNFARVYGAINPAFTGSVTGAVNGDVFTESFSTAAAPLSIVGAYPIVPSVSGSGAANYAVAVTNGSLTISPAGTSTLIAMSNLNLTITATVASVTTGSPTGSVAFYEGQTLVGTGTISNGTASYTTSSFPPGDVVVSAQYSGDPNFTNSSSPPLLFLSVSPASTALTVSRGSNVTDSLSLSVIPGYAGTLQFACAGLPASTKCTFSPSTVTFSGTTTSAAVTVTIGTNTKASLSTHSLPSSGEGQTDLAIGTWLSGLLISGCWTKRKKLSARIVTLLSVSMMCAVMWSFVGCGVSNTTPQTPAGSYNVQIVTTGSSGLTQSTGVTLAVQ